MLTGIRSVLNRAMTDKEYNECVELHADALYRFILKNMRNSDDAKDVVQSAFEKMWAKRHTVDNLHCKPFLFSVAYHEMIDQIRKQKKRTVMEERPLYNRGSDHKKLLEMALSRLTERERSLILLKDWEGYSYEEIGMITDLNPLQVKVYLHRARLKVRNYLGSLENVIELSA